MKFYVLVLALVCVFNIFTDSRDNTPYTIQKISHQIWLKENIRYLFPTANTTDSLSLKIDSFYDKYGAYYSFKAAKKACPEGYHLPTLREWKTFISDLPGKPNTRQGKLIPTQNLSSFGLNLGGMSTRDTVFMSRSMGYYWTASDTLKPYYKQPEQGNLRHLIGLHIWNSGESDSINIEPTYMLAQQYEPQAALNCKCIKD